MCNHGSNIMAHCSPTLFSSAMRVVEQTGVVTGRLCVQGSGDKAGLLAD